jgi:hypothetical protein
VLAHCVQLARYLPCSARLVEQPGILTTTEINPVLFAGKHVADRDTLFQYQHDWVKVFVRKPSNPLVGFAVAPVASETTADVTF